MSKYAEARRSRKERKPDLHHLRIYASGNHDSHVIEHHLDDDSVESHEFPHDRNGNLDAIKHLAVHMGMVPNLRDEQEEED